jgi:hypothetical protein
MPLKYWDGAFLTATFLINLLPAKSLILILLLKGFSMLHQIMMLFEPLVVLVGQIFDPITHANLIFAPSVVSSLVIALFIKESNV